MAEIKLLLPNESSGNLKQDFEDLKDKFVSVLKELEFTMANLDEENVTRADSVYAEKIDTTHAKIKDAQIQSLTANKLTAGTIDADEINVVNLNADNISSGTLNTSNVAVASDGGKLYISDGLITLFDSQNTMRLMMGLDTRDKIEGITNPNYNKFYFCISDKNGNDTVYFDDLGDGVFAGVLDTKKNISVGSKIVMQNARDSGSGIYFTSGAQTLASISIDGEDKAVYINANGGVYTRGERLATESYVNEAILNALLSGGIN